MALMMRIMTGEEGSACIEQCESHTRTIDEVPETEGQHDGGLWGVRELEVIR